MMPIKFWIHLVYRTFRSVQCAQRLPLSKLVMGMGKTIFTFYEAFEQQFFCLKGTYYISGVIISRESQDCQMGVPGSVVS